MPLTKLVLLVLLGSLAIVFIVSWGRALWRSPTRIWPSRYQLGVGFVTDFLDTLGVGSFATTTALWRVGISVEDAKIPGTLNVGHTLPTILQALIYIHTIDVDLTTLWLLIAAAVFGSYWGASWVTRLSVPAIQRGVGIALLIAASLILAKLLRWIPSGGDSLGLSGYRLLLGTLGTMVFGALMTIGVGAYAPIMIMVSLLAMNQKAAFPIMMGACAFLMPVASYRFVQSNKYDAPGALGLTLLGLPGVAIAAWIVQQLPVTALQWMVVLIVIYTACSLIHAASKSTANHGK